MCMLRYTYLKFAGKKVSHYTVKSKTLNQCKKVLQLVTSNKIKLSELNIIEFNLLITLIPMNSFLFNQ